MLKFNWFILIFLLKYTNGKLPLINGYFNINLKEILLKLLCLK